MTSFSTLGSTNPSTPFILINVYYLNEIILNLNDKNKNSYLILREINPLEMDLYKVVYQLLKIQEHALIHSFSEFLMHFLLYFQ